MRRGGDFRLTFVTDTSFSLPSCERRWGHVEVISGVNIASNSITLFSAYRIEVSCGNHGNWGMGLSNRDPRTICGSLVLSSRPLVFYVCKYVCLQSCHFEIFQSPLCPVCCMHFLKLFTANAVIFLEIILWGFARLFPFRTNLGEIASPQAIIFARTCPPPSLRRSMPCFFIFCHIHHAYGRA